jgi:transcriptional regulator with XRE-family HTH domain
MLNFNKKRTVSLNLNTRLVEERKRLKFNQKDFSVLAGVSKTTQFNYEKGERVPDALYLQTLSEAGVDILYVITGSRSLNLSLSSEEAALVDNYRASTEKNKSLLEGVGASFAEQIIKKELG